MRKMFLLAGAAALAASLPSLADAQGNGRGGGRGGDQASQGRGGGGGHEMRGNRGGGHEARGNRGGGQEARGRGHDRAERHADRQERRVERRAERQEQRVERHADRAIERDMRRQERNVRHIERDVRRDMRDVERQQRRDIRQARLPEQLRGVDRGIDRDLGDRFAHWRDGRPLPVTVARGNCPPGLARQNAFCMPPGQLRRAQLIGQQLPFASAPYNIPDRYRYRFEDNDRHYYRYGEDGYVYRFDQGRNLVSQVIPLYPTQLMVGEPMPLGYEVYNLPLQYRDHYRDGDEHLYRYDDNAIYRVDGETGIVEAIVALLTGGGGGSLGGLGGALGGLGGLGVGQMLPSGYDVYNVPMQYRDRYADSDEHLYRYADNNIYQVDPQTQLIEQVISLLG